MIGAAKKIWSSSFFRGVATLTLGTIAGQAIMMAALPLITRFFTPEDFGLLGVFMSLVAVLSVAICLRLEMAVVLPEDEKDGINLVALGILSATTLSLLIGLIFWLVPNFLTQFSNNEKLKDILLIIPLAVWLTGTYNILQFWSIRKRRYIPVALTQVSRAVGGAGAQITFGVTQIISNGLVWGQLIYTAFGSLGLFRLFIKHDRYLFSAISKSAMKRNFIRQKRFPIYSVPEALFNTAATNLPLVIVAAVAGAAEAGFMLLALKITNIPLGFVGRSISRVYLAEAGAKIRAGTLGPFTRNIMFQLFKAGIIPFIGLAITAPFLFGLVFGEGWERSGQMVLWIIPYMMMALITSPVSTILLATENQRIAMFLQMFAFTLLIGATLISSYFPGKPAFEFFTVASFIYYSVYFCVVMRITLRPIPIPVETTPSPSANSTD